MLSFSLPVHCGSVVPCINYPSFHGGSVDAGPHALVASRESACRQAPEP